MMNANVMRITPEIAAEWLENHNSRNRVLRQNSVIRFANDMAAGNWKLTHQGIAFDRDGELIDGQHRLAAIVKSGATVDMVVTTGMDHGVVDSIDIMNPRNYADSMTIKNGRSEYYTKVTLALARFAQDCIMLRKVALTPSEYETFVNANKEELSWCLSLKGRNARKMNAPVSMAAIAADLNGVSRDAISRCLSLAFDNEIDDTVSKETNKAILDYANKLCPGAGSGRVIKREVYARTKAVIYSYVNGFKRIRYSGDDLYPIHITPGFEIAQGEKEFMRPATNSQPKPIYK